MEAIDMGPAGVLEVRLLPEGAAGTNRNAVADPQDGPEGVRPLLEISDAGIDPDLLFRHHARPPSADAAPGDDLAPPPANALSGASRNANFESRFVGAVGGLRPQISAIVRRVLDGRVLRPPSESDAGAAAAAQSSALDAAALDALGLGPVRGLLLYGPPGCGKTRLARELARALGARAPKVVAAPELLDRWVGGSERLIRDLFADAEAELAAAGGVADRSALHVVVIDEIDAVFRRRTDGADGGEVTRSSAVNQILAKLDGVDALPNVLVVGMTNRRELLDEALLRPGRLEVHVEIPLPDAEGRREIAQIHFGPLRDAGRLSEPLCAAIDGGDRGGRRRGKRAAALNFVLRPWRGGGAAYIEDLASDDVTDGFSGADIAGLVRCAGSIALARAREDGGGVEGLIITLEDVAEALKEVKN